MSGKKVIIFSAVTETKHSLIRQGCIMTDNKKLTTAFGCPVVDNQNTLTAGPRGPVLLQDVWLLEKLAHFDREVIPERRMHAKGSGAYGTFTVTHDITQLHALESFRRLARERNYSLALLQSQVNVVLQMRSVIFEVLQ